MDCKQSPSDDAAAQYDLGLGDLSLEDLSLDDPSLDDPSLGPIDRPDPYLTDADLDGDTLREECGVFGIFGHPDAAAITALGLHALQHRGQEAAGIVSFDGKRFHSERRLGLVGDAFSRREVIDRLVDDLLTRALLRSTAESVELDCELLGVQPAYLVRELLIAVWKRQGWPLQAMGYVEWEQLAGMVLTAGVETKRVFPGEIVAEHRGGSLRLSRG